MNAAPPSRFFAFTLRSRLFLSLLPFVVFLIATAVYDWILIDRLGRTLACVHSVVATRFMEVALSNIERGMTAVSEGQREAGAQLITQGLAVFEENLQWLNRNQTIREGIPLSRTIETHYQALRALALRAKASKTAPDLDPETIPAARGHWRELEPLLAKLRVLNELESPPLASLSGMDLAKQSSLLMLAGTGAVVIVSVLAVIVLSRSLLRPITALTDATRAVARGELDRLVPVLAHDELGQLAREFNRMAAELKRYRESADLTVLRLLKTRDATLASFPDPIFVLNSQGAVETRNPAAARLVQALGLREALPPRLSELAAKVRQSGTNFLPEQFDAIVTLRVHGQDRFFLPRVLLVRSDAGEVLGTAVVLLDMTRFRLLDDAKSNLVGTVSHELRTPLTSVRMVLYMLLEKSLGPLTAGQEELLATARDDTERTLRILNDLLDLSRLERGHVELQFEMVEPSTLLEHAIADQRDFAAAREVKLLTEAEPRLPSVPADSQRLSHVFANCLRNAIKFSPPGSTVTLRAVRAHNNDVRFSVRDQGPGIAAEYQPRIFDRFFRVPGQSNAGTGLGLSIAREIVLAHGGQMGVTSELGKGSEFFFILPGENTATKPRATPVPSTGQVPA
jgi:signal transduction histidine kinase